MLEAQGYPDQDGSLTKVAKHLNVPLSTLRGWFYAKNNPPPSELRNEKKRDLAALIEDEALKALEQMGVTRVEAEYRELATAFGIMFDKLQLLQGKPTEINEVNVTDQRNRIMARLAEQSGGYVTGTTQKLGAGPNGSGVPSG